MHWPLIPQKGLSPASSRLSLAAFAAIIAVMSSPTLAHEHPTIVSSDPTTPKEPIDGILYGHIAIMFAAWGFIFPIGMVLGLTKSRFHVPVQLTGVILTTIGWFLGHIHGGRAFPYSAHAAFSWIVVIILAGQTVAGLYLKLHWEWGPNKFLRVLFVKGHGISGKILPVVGYVQIVFGFIAALGFCWDDHLGQCLAHFIMGSSFIGYGIVYIISMRLFVSYFERRGKSQEYFDSWVIMIWGIVNTFTEHRFNEPWSHKDFQHTAMGIIWWAGGLTGIFLSRNGRRSVIPALIVFLTGFAMSSHAQGLEISTKLHAVFGYTLMLGGIARIIEICFVLKDKHGSKELKAFQHLPPFALISGGLLFMGVNEEQVRIINNAMIDPFSYALVLYSLGFLIYLYTTILVLLWQHSGKNADRNQNGAPIKLNGGGADADREVLMERANSVEDFELGALLSDDEEEDIDSPVVEKSENISRFR